MSRFSMLARSLVVSAIVLMLQETSCSTSSSSPTSHSSDAGGTEAGACASDVPGSCPASPKPSYKSDIAPLLDAKCNDCHTGGAGPWSLASYDDVAHWRGAIVQTLAKCSMPPSDAGQQLTPDERANLLAWLVCGAPNN